MTEVERDAGTMKAEKTRSTRLAGLFQFAGRQISHFQVQPLHLACRGGPHTSPCIESQAACGSARLAPVFL